MSTHKRQLALFEPDIPYYYIILLTPSKLTQDEQLIILHNIIHTNVTKDIR